MEKILMIIFGSIVLIVLIVSFCKSKISVSTKTKIFNSKIEFIIKKENR